MSLQRCAFLYNTCNKHKQWTCAGSADTRQIDIEESPEQKQDEELDVWSAAAGIHARADSDADRGDSDGRIRSDDAAHDETQQYQDDTGVNLCVTALCAP